jgi:hypothetical protein
VLPAPPPPALDDSATSGGSQKATLKEAPAPPRPPPIALPPAPPVSTAVTMQPVAGAVKFCPLSGVSKNVPVGSAIEGRTAKGETDMEGVFEGVDVREGVFEGVGVKEGVFEGVGVKEGVLEGVRVKEGVGDGVEEGEAPEEIVAVGVGGTTAPQIRVLSTLKADPTEPTVTAVRRQHSAGMPSAAAGSSGVLCAGKVAPSGRSEATAPTFENTPALPVELYDHCTDWAPPTDDAMSAAHRIEDQPTVPVQISSFCVVVCQQKLLNAPKVNVGGLVQPATSSCVVPAPKLVGRFGA